MILYKYFKEEKLRELWLKDNGSIYFSPIEFFQKIKCENRKDELENTIIFRGPQKIQINNNAIYAENIRISNDIIGNYISCFSTELKDELRVKWGNFILRFDASNFLLFLDSIKIEGITFYHKNITYSSDQTFTSDPFVKRKLYEPESEYRILMKIRNNQKIEDLKIKGKDHFPLNFENGLKQHFSLLN